MTTSAAVGFVIVWYATWGVAGHLNSSRYLHRLAALEPAQIKPHHATLASALSYVYLFAGVAPLLYRPFLDAVVLSTPLLLSLPLIIVLCAVPALLKFRAAAELAERGRRKAGAGIKVAVEDWHQRKAS